jgi:hypothetical protein
VQYLALANLFSMNECMNSIDYALKSAKNLKQIDSFANDRKLKALKDIWLDTNTILPLIKR